MRTLILAVLAWTLGSALVRAEESPYPQMIVAARQAFELGVQNRTRPLRARQHFSDAADHYLALHRLGLREPALYLNLGNAAVLADRWPEALWAYHVGLKLDPNDARLRAQRESVRAKVLLPPYGQGRNEPERWPTWLHRPSLDLYAIIAGAGYALAWFAGTLAVVRGSGRLALATCLSVAITFASAFGLGYDFWQVEADGATPLVIIADNTPLFRGNGANYPAHPDIAILPRGMEARQLHRRGGWLQIHLTSGEIGWVPATAALVVAP